jgi:hypothetical protein
MHRRTFSLAVLAAALPVLARADPSAKPALAVGQEWSAKDTPAKVVIGRIEDLGDGHIAVSVSLVEVPTDHGPRALAHLPFDQAALVASLDQLLATGVALDPEFEQGYQQWKRANGGVFTIPVAQVAALARTTLDRSAGGP